MANPQGPTGLRGHIDRKQNEGCTHELMNSVFSAFEFLGIGSPYLERSASSRLRSRSVT